MLLDCDIHFDVYRDGHVASAWVRQRLDATEELFPQARAKVMDWIDRKDRIWGQQYELMAITAVQYQFNGRWHTGLEWSPDVLDHVESRPAALRPPSGEGSLK